MPSLNIEDFDTVCKIGCICHYTKVEVAGLVNSVLRLSNNTPASSSGILTIIYHKLSSMEWSKSQVLDFNIVKLHINNIVELNAAGLI